MAQPVNLNLGLAPHDPWVIKKLLTSSDVRAQFMLPKQEVEAYIIPQMNEQVLVEDMVNGVEVKIHIVEEGHEAPDYNVMLLLYNGVYMLKGGWPVLARSKGYKKDDVIGLMWDKWSSRFFLHHIIKPPVLV